MRSGQPPLYLRSTQKHPLTPAVIGMLALESVPRGQCAATMGSEINTRTLRCILPALMIHTDDLNQQIFHTTGMALNTGCVVGKVHRVHSGLHVWQSSPFCNAIGLGAGGSAVDPQTGH